MPEKGPLIIEDNDEQQDGIRNASEGLCETGLLRVETV